MKIIKKGFTLIELLVVISIIALLATLLMANFNATRSRARDAQRKSDLRNIQTALRLYYNDYQSYPDNSGVQIAGCTDGDDACTWGGNFLGTGYTYMSVLPEDPQSDRRYVYDGVDGDNYTLSTCLENGSDDRCDTGSTSCSTSYSTATPAVTLSGCTYTVRP